MKPLTLLFLAITAVSAGCGLVVEIVAGRMIAPYLGMSLYTWTSIIAVVLAGFSLGHWIGGLIAERQPGAVRRGVAWSLLLAGVSSLASLILIRLLAAPIIALGLPPVPTILLLTTALFFLPSVFVGIPSPALTKLAIDEEASTRMGHVLGAFFAAGAVGSIVGTLAAGFVFISWLGTIGTILTVAVLYGVMGVVLLLVDARQPDGRLSVTSVAVFLVAVASIFATGMSAAAFRSPCDAESDYYCIRIVEAEGALQGRVRSMVLDHLEHGSNVRDRPQALITPYVEAQDALARVHAGRRTPFRTFFIGGGVYTLPRAWLAARPDAAVVVAEVDPQVTALARSRLWLEDDARLCVLHRDARAALALQPSAHFDVIVGDAFHDISVPQHLVTDEFFALVADRLHADGIFLMNAVDSLSQPRFMLSLVRTLRAHFAVVEVWRSNQTGDRATLVIAGLRRATPQSVLRSRVRRGLAFERMAPERLQALASAHAPLRLSDDYAPVDRLVSAQ